MSGLEICDAAAVPLDAYPVLAEGGKASRLTVAMLDFYTEYSRVRGWTDSAIFDLTPVMQLLRPEIFTGKHYAIDVETQGELCRGMTVADFTGTWEQPKTTFVLEAVDKDAYVETFLDSIRKLDTLVG